MAGKKVLSYASSKQAKTTQRQVVVFSALAGSLTATALLLQLLSPDPVRAQASVSLFAPEPQEAIARAVSQASQPWSSIYIHQSKTAEGDAQSLAGNGDLGDHFVIGNGNLAGDGEMQIGVRWTGQLPAIAPKGVARINSDCISICLIGDLDRKAPSATQLHRLSTLVRTLQTRHGIPASQIFMIHQANSPAGIGQQFPMDTFKRQILPSL